MGEFKSRFGKDVRVDPNADALSPDRKFADPDLGAAILDDHKKYFTPEYMEAEWQRLWSRTWNIAGRVNDLARPGDYFLFELGRESFIITRTRDGGIKAFYNVCHHRGSRIMRKPLGHASSFVCPFHSWTWNLDGSLKRITDRETFEEAVVCDNPSLAEVRCEVWAGFVFINMDDQAKPLADFLGEFAHIMANYRMEEMDIVTDMETDWPVNWKTVLDAFMEGYHAHARHPQLMGLIDDYHFQHDLWDHGHSRMIIPMGIKSPRTDPNKMTPELKELAEAFDLDPATFEGRANALRDALPMAKKEWAAKYNINFDHFTDSQLSDDWNLNIFPNITLNAHPEGVLVMRFRPHATDPERCFYDVWVLARKVNSQSYTLPTYMPVFDGDALKPGSGRPERVYGKFGETSFGMVLDQDGETVPLVQAGVKSRAFRGVRLSYQEIRLRHFYREYDRYITGS